MAEDEMVGWYHRLSGHEIEQAPEDEGQGRPGKPAVLQSMGSQRVRHDSATEQQRRLQSGRTESWRQCCSRPPPPRLPVGWQWLHSFAKSHGFPRAVLPVAGSQ